MRVKKFEAKNMKDALQMVKNELGPDAVILSARDNRKSFGIGGQPSVEVTAAVSESTLHKKHFVESRMTANDRARFQNTDARTQRQIIDRMVENRMKQNEQEARARRPITPVSYIDIPDDVVESAPPQRRKPNYERAAGRSVSDLLNDFEQDFGDGDGAWQEPVQRQQPRARQQAPQRPAQQQTQQQAQPQRQQARSNQQQQQQMMRQQPRYQTPVEQGYDFQEDEQQTQQPVEAAQPSVSEKALSRIRNAAREAFNEGGLFASEEPKSVRGVAKAVAATVKGAGQGGLEMIRETAPQPAPAPQVMPPPVPSGVKDSEIATLKTEISRLQQMLEGFQKPAAPFVGMHPGAEFGIPYDLSAMFQMLTGAGVTIDFAVELLQIAAKEIDPMQIKKRPIVEAWVARYFLTNLQVVPAISAGRVHQFVGGAGSGKTTTMIKMASHLVVKEKKRVAILSTDAFKVGAVDQLKIYCQILNVPFAVIRNRKDWEWVLGQLQQMDHILVDFPGLQLRDLDEVHLLKSLLPPMEVAPVTHFCQSVTTKDGDAYEMARRYRITDYNDLIFTNLDQSVQHGIIYNLHKKTGKPLHSFGIGNRLPEDFEPASKERVLDLIFKLTHLRRESK